jgi:hypothetical protein
MKMRKKIIIFVAADNIMNMIKYLNKIIFILIYIIIYVLIHIYIIISISI